MQVFFVWQNLAILVFGIWLIALTIVVYRYLALFYKLTKGIESGDLKQVLEKLIAKGEANEKLISVLTKRIAAVEEDGRLHVQKVGLVRFNPFKELGGDHSFSLAILDGEGDGVIMTSLHTRDRTRVYMKAIKNRKSDVELSGEEIKALNKAK